MDTKSIVATELEEFFMKQAIEEARQAGERGEVPVGAVIVNEHQNVLAAAGNNCIGESDPSGHADATVSLRQCL